MPLRQPPLCILQRLAETVDDQVDFFRCSDQGWAERNTVANVADNHAVLLAASIEITTDPAKRLEPGFLRFICDQLNGGNEADTSDFPD